jgi:pescadillo protein
MDMGFKFLISVFSFLKIVDRPTQGHKYLSREYVQPQWIYDCINARIILPTEAYMVGR